ncbi:MAG: hypothetical protein A3F80_00780 [Candidatus Melainabacteria bacterium RIFCSPLOWO2_12_FULL_35_11]|nr:MAG: hypothetical protein A3F80_00780 [Candidatus Melainabacteria bacterium RIFCSPLOWO2_12_FULL_35_11]
MFNKSKKIIVCCFFLLGLLFYVCNSSFANIEIKNNQKSVIWTGTLSLQDFFLLPDYLEIKNKLKEYKTVLAKEYKENPSVFSTAIQYGLLLVDLGELEKAKLVWEKALKDFHANEAPKAYKAWLDARLGNYQAAKDVWYPIAKGKVDVGIAGYSARIWLSYHTDAVLGLYLIKDFLPEDQREEVSEVVDLIAGTLPQNPKFAAVVINEYLKSGQLEKAAKLLTGVLSSNPDDPVLITLLGIAKLMTSHYDEALKLFDRAKEINPNILTNRIMRARALFALNKEKESFEELDEAMKLNPDLNIAENKKKKYLAAKNYIVSKKLKKDKEI